MQIEMQQKNKLGQIIPYLDPEKNNKKINLVEEILIITQLLTKKMLDISPNFFKILVEQILLSKIIENGCRDHLTRQEVSTKDKEFIQETEKVFALANGITVAPLVPTLFKDPISANFYRSVK